MLSLAKPVSQDHLNFAVVEVIGLNIMGVVHIPGQWDIHNTLEYIETKIKQSCTLYQDPEEGFFFNANNKQILFTASGILIQAI